MSSDEMGFLTSYLLDEDIARLLIVGNKQLSALMLRPGSVLKLLVLEKPELCPSFPNILRGFPSLKSLEFPYTSGWNGSFCFSVLPNSLTALRVADYFSPTAAYLGPGFFDVGQSLPNLKTLEFGCEISPEVGGLFRWMNTFLPSLTDLTIANLHPDCPLPSSLEYLKIKSYDNVSNSSPPPPLPEGLKALIFHGSLDWTLFCLPYLAFWNSWNLGESTSQSGVGLKFKIRLYSHNF
jgi:hypothetical protein